MEKHKAEGKAVAKGSGRVDKTTRPKRKAKAKTEPVPSGAASSGGLNK